MILTLIGCGCGRGTLTLEARAAIEKAQLLVGAPRLLEEFPEAAERKPARSAKEILEALQQADGRDTAILFSGDSGFYSGAGTLFSQLEGEAPVLLPGISSLQVLSARLRSPGRIGNYVPRTERTATRRPPSAKGNRFSSSQAENSARRSCARI